MSWEFLLTSFIIVATPGTGALYTIAAGLSRGAQAGILAAFAGTLGIVPHVAAAVLGLAALLHASAVAFDLIKYAGVAYLLWMAWQSWRGVGSLALTTDAAPRGVWRVLVDGLALNLLNPKLTIFFVAFLPQFVTVDGVQPLRSMLELSGAFMLMTFVVFAIYGVFAAAIRARVLSRPGIVARVQKTFAIAFAGMAMRLAVQER